MNVWRVTKADRDAEGKIRVTPPERHLADLLPPAPIQARPAEEETQRWRLGRLEQAGSVLGLVLALALIVVIGRVVPARQEGRAPAVAPPLPAPTRVRPSPTRTPTRTPAPTATPVPPTPTLEPPTPQVIYVQVAPPCDPSNPPFVVQQDVYDGTVPLGWVTGSSCESLEAARANAEAHAAEMRQAHDGGGKP
jgi:hypothetical protein